MDQNQFITDYVQFLYIFLTKFTFTINGIRDKLDLITIVILFISCSVAPYSVLS